METRLIGGRLVWDEDQANVARDMGNLNLDDGSCSRYDPICEEKPDVKSGKGLASMGINTFGTISGGAQSTNNLQNPSIAHANNRVGKKQNKASPGRKTSSSRRRLVSPPPKIDGFTREANSDPVPVMRKSDTEKRHLSEMRQRKILAYKQEVQKEHRAQRVRDRRRNAGPYGADFGNGTDGSAGTRINRTNVSEKAFITSVVHLNSDDDERHATGKKVAFVIDNGSDLNVTDTLDMNVG